MIVRFVEAVGLLAGKGMGRMVCCTFRVTLFARGTLRDCAPRQRFEMGDISGEYRSGAIYGVVCCVIPISVEN